MAEVEVSIERDEIQRLIHSDEGLAGLVEQVLNQLLEAEIAHHLGAGRHERSPDRRGRRNGHYRRSLTTRVGTLELAVPRDREGRFQTELFERYQRSEKALVLSLLEMVVNGVSTRKVARITEELCGRAFKRSTVSELAKQLDAQVEAWSERPLEGVFPFLIVDAMQIKVRREDAVRPTSVLIAVAVNEQGLREIVGLRVADSESEQSWRDLFARPEAARPQRRRVRGLRRPRRPGLGLQAGVSGRGLAAVPGALPAQRRRPCLEAASRRAPPRPGPDPGRPRSCGGARGVRGDSTRSWRAKPSGRWRRWRRGWRTRSRC